MAYNNNARSNALYPRTFYTLYIGLNDSATGHLMFKLSTKQILITLKYKPVPMPENLTRTINEMDIFTTKIQNNHFDSDHYTAIAQEDHFDNTQDDNQNHCDDKGNPKHESYDELDNSQQIDGMKSDTGIHQENEILQNMGSSIFINLSMIKPT